jgi:hypothetical protein
MPLLLTFEKLETGNEKQVPLTTRNIIRLTCYSLGPRH